MDLLQEKHLDTSRSLHYRYYVSSATQADSTKPTLLLCHGWPDSALLWKFIIPHLLKSKLRLIVPDLLGYGGTSKPFDPAQFEVKAMVTDVMEIFQAEGIDSKIIPIGHDWGSYFAQRVYMLNRARMAGLITLNVALMIPSEKPFDLEATLARTEQLLGYPTLAYWDVFADPEGPKLMEQHLDSLWYAMHGDSDECMKQLFCSRGAMRDWLSNDRKDVTLRPYAQSEELKKEWIEQAIPGGLVSPGCWYRATNENFQLETESKLEAKIETPYLFIGCDGDAVCRTDAIEMSKKAGLVPDLEVHELHSGHWCPYEKPDEVATIVLSWLKKKEFTDA